eukprot:1750303-Alexandrium_andersonii.AAC.1
MPPMNPEGPHLHTGARIGSPETCLALQTEDGVPRRRQLQSSKLRAESGLCLLWIRSVAR